MLGDNDIKKTPLKLSEKNGTFLLTIQSVSALKNEHGEDVLYKDSHGVVFTFAGNEIVHQELFWVSGYNRNKLIKLMMACGCDIDAIKTKQIVGKRFWADIVQIINVTKGTKKAVIKKVYSVGQPPKIKENLVEYE